MRGFYASSKQLRVRVVYVSVRVKRSVSVSTQYRHVYPKYEQPVWQVLSRCFSGMNGFAFFAHLNWKLHQIDSIDDRRGVRVHRYVLSTQRLLSNSGIGTKLVLRYSKFFYHSCEVI